MNWVMHGADEGGEAMLYLEACMTGGCVWAGWLPVLLHEVGGCLALFGLRLGMIIPRALCATLNLLLVPPFQTLTLALPQSMKSSE